MKLSVVMPLYNKAPHIEATLSALAAQERPPDELIVVDDASTDDSLARVERFLATHPIGLEATRVELVRLPRNGGPGNARNQGLSRVTGDHVHLLDADDRLYPGCFARVNEVIERHAPDLLVLGYRRTEGGVPRPTLATLRPLLTPLSAGLYELRSPVAALSNDGLGVIGSNLVCRRERLQGITYDTRSSIFEGVDFWYRCFTSSFGPRVLLLADPCMDYVELPDGLLSRKAKAVGDISVPVLFERLRWTEDPHAKALRRRIARAWLSNTLERLPTLRLRAELLFRKRDIVSRAVRWSLSPP